MSSQPFPGFPARLSFTPLPNLFFTELLPRMGSLPELKLTLHIFWRLYQKRGALKFVTYRELVGDKTLIEGMEGTSSPDGVLRNALEAAVDRGVLLRLVLEREAAPEEVYFINNEASRRAIARVQSGELSLGALPQPQPYIKEEIKEFLQDKLKLELHPKKANIFPAGRGIEFLGYRIFGNYRLLRKSTVKRFIKRTKIYQKRLDRGLMSREKFESSLQSWIAYAEFGNSYRLRKNIFKKVNSQCNCGI